MIISFQGDSPVLKSLIVIVHKLIVVVLVYKITVFFCKNVIGTDIYFRQLGLMRVFDQKTSLAL